MPMPSGTPSGTGFEASDPVASSAPPPPDALRPPLAPHLDVPHLDVRDPRYGKPAPRRWAGRLFALGIGLIVVALGAYLLTGRPGTQTASGKPVQGGAARATPVVATPAHSGELPVF